MKRYKEYIKVLFFLPFYFFALLPFAACSEDDNSVEEYPNWQNTNSAYWDNLFTTTQQKIAGGDSSWKIIKNFSLSDSLQSPNTDYVIVNVEKNGTDSGCPLYTDSVQVRYTGQLLPSTSHPDGYVFDTTNSDSVPDSQAGVANFAVSGLVSGFQTALQHMHIGDKWKVYIPWTLGYGTTQSSSSNIPAYSVLIFDIELVAYSHAGSNLPDFKAKRNNWVSE